MRSRTSITVESELQREGLGYRAAVFLSYLINPLILPPLGIALILAHLGASGFEIGMMTVLAVIFFGIVPLAYVLKMVREGEVESINLPRKEDRTDPMVVCLGSYAVAAVVMGLQSVTATAFIIALVGLNVVNTLLVIAINRVWKISLHMISLAAFTSTLLFVALYDPGMLGGTDGGAFSLSVSGLLLFALLLPLLMWARVRVGAHTVPQVAAGTAFGLAVPFAQLYLFAEFVLGA